MFDMLLFFLSGEEMNNQQDSMTEMKIHKYAPWRQSESMNRRKSIFGLTKFLYRMIVNCSKDKRTPLGGSMRE